MKRALAVLSLVLVSACQCGDPLEKVPEHLPVEHKDGRVLVYVGDEPLAVHFGEERQLRFTRKNADGSPVEGDKIAIEIHGTYVTTPGDSYVTDVGGGVEVPVFAGTTVGEATVVAKAIDVDGSIDEAVVHVDVSEAPVASLNVTVVSQTRIPVVTANATIITGQSPPDCAALASGVQLPVPFATHTFDAPFPSSFDVAGVATHDMAVVVVDGFNADGTKIASSCNEAGPLPGGVDTPITVTLDQGASSLAGDYDVLMHMALGQALPSPYDTDLDLISALLADPAGFALYFVLREIDRQTGFTTFVTHNGVEFTYDEVSADAAVNPGDFPTWSFARNQLNTFLTNQLGQTYTDITNVGAALRDVVTDFEVGTRLGVTQNSDGTLTVHEQWHDIVLYWPLPCAAGDLACARKPLSLDDMNLSPVTATYGAQATYAPNADVSERYAVVTDAHGLNLRYGALLVAILEQVVFPSLPGGVPNEDFGQFLQNLIGCPNIAASLTSDPTAEQFVTGVCDAGLQLAGGVIQTQLEQLQVDAAGPDVAGLQSSGSFSLLDRDQDLVTEEVADYDYAVGWNDPANPSTFQDISSPITGAGFRVREACVVDGECAAGFACVPRASYLQVAEVQLGCERAKGSLAGMQACTADAQCASGLCSPVGPGGTLQCFASCNADAQCGAESCSDTGGALDLDSVLNGLGDVAFNGCSAL